MWRPLGSVSFEAGKGRKDTYHTAEVQPDVPGSRYRTGFSEWLRKWPCRRFPWTSRQAVEWTRSVVVQDGKTMHGHLLRLTRRHDILSAGAGGEP